MVLAQEWFFLAITRIKLGLTLLNLWSSLHGLLRDHIWKFDQVCQWVACRWQKISQLISWYNSESSKQASSVDSDFSLCLLFCLSFLEDSFMSLGTALAFGGFVTLWRCGFTCAMLSGLLGIAGFAGAHRAKMQWSETPWAGLGSAHSLCVCKHFTGNVMLCGSRVREGLRYPVPGIPLSPGTQVGCCFGTGVCMSVLVGMRTHRSRRLFQTAVPLWRMDTSPSIFRNSFFFFL